MGSDTKTGDKDPDFLEQNRKAEALIESGDLPAAARILVAIVDKAPDNWQAFNNMGIISWRRGAFDDAYATFLHACELKPDYVDALINLFDVSLKLRKINDILPVLKKGLQAVPDHEEIKAIVESIEDQGDGIYSTERAMRVLKKSVSSDENRST